MSEKNLQTEADLIWEEVKSLPIDVFAVQNQKVDQYVKKLDVPGTALYVKITSSAVLPALETTLSSTNLTRGKKYSIDMGEGFLIIKRQDDGTQKVQEAISKLEASSKSKKNK